ncbi:MAG: hypothetical protein HY742_00045 [Deltaproteobacteria bacterium]|nr:hypothetical protein [Deltaproteobacteria bacterium]
MITTISKHMARSAVFLGNQSSSRFLGIIHLVEMCRYHLYQFEMLAAGQGTAPPGFQPGINIPQPDENHEIDHLYRFMVTWFEVEAFFMSAKRLLDNCWILLAEHYKNGAETIGTLGSALDRAKMHKAIKSEKLEARICSDKYYCELQRIWNAWGKELTEHRNYFEHEIPFGGMTFNKFKMWQHEGRQYFDTFLPDQIRSGKKRIPKQQFTFNQERSLTHYIRERMDDIDTLVEALFPIPYGHPLVE